MTLNMLNNALTFTTNVARVFEAGRDLREVIRDSDIAGAQRTARVVADTGSIIFHGACLTPLLTEVSPNTKSGLEVGAGIFDIAQKTAVVAGKRDIRVGEYIDLGCQVIFRAVSITQTTLILKPEIFGNQVQNVKQLSDITLSICRIIQLRGSIQKTYPLGADMLKRTIDLAAGRDLTLEISLNMDASGNNLPLKLRFGNRMSPLIAEIEDARTIDEFDVIPELFATDPQLNRFVCPLSQKPIRRVLVVQGTEHRAHPVYYERSKITGFLHDSPTRIPKGWPIEISYERANLASFPPAQNQINDRLQLLFNTFKTLSNIPTPIRERIMELARQLGIGQVSDSEVTDQILRKISGDSVRSVSVKRDMKRFIPEGPLKLSTVIIVKSSKVFLDGQDHSNLEKQQAICAFLGSSEENDREILKNVMKSFRDFEFYVSQDLQDLSENFSR